MIYKERLEKILGIFKSILLILSPFLFISYEYLLFRYFQYLFDISTFEAHWFSVILSIISTIFLIYIVTEGKD